MAMGTDIKGTIFLIVTKIVTPKALGEGGCQSTTDGDMDNSSRGREDTCSIGERLKKGPVKG